MNCHHARQLISPYLDGQLTGREMLALGDHLAGCESCQDEIDSLRLVKNLLRGLHAPAPRLEFSRRLSSHEILAESAAWKQAALPPRPQRGRRLISALALSCLTVLAFAPASRESQSAASVAPSAAFPSPSRLTSAAGQNLSAPMGPGLGYQFSGSPRHGFIIFSAADITDHAFSYAPSYREQPYREQPYEPSPTGFQPGTAALINYRPR